MLPLYTTEEFTRAKSTDILPLNCKSCQETFYRTKQCIQRMLAPSKQNRKSSGDFCSRKCDSAYRNIGHLLDVVCKQCGALFSKTLSQAKKHPHHFCCQSCAASFNNHQQPKRKKEVPGPGRLWRMMNSCAECGAPCSNRGSFCWGCYKTRRRAAGDLKLNQKTKGQLCTYDAAVFY